MFPSLDSLSSNAASASGLEGTSPSVDEAVSRPTPPSVTDSVPPAETSGKEKESWWEWLTHKADEVEDWVDGFIHEHVPEQENKDDDKVF